MQTEWTIAGEADQGWDDIPRSLEYRRINSARLAFNSLQADDLTFNIVVEDIATEVFTATPTVAPDSSVRIGSTVDVVISCTTAGAIMRYTTDGSSPTSSSPTIANGGTLTIANPSTLKVRAVAPDMLSSDVKVAQYVAQRVVATGGLVTDAGGFRIHTFLTSGSFVVTNPGAVEYLVVGGGGSGGQNTGTRAGGGGGAGGFRTAIGLSLAADTYEITVGAGGIAQALQNLASDGGNSSIGSLVISNGGGAGASASGTAQVQGRNGGSGGGGVETTGGLGTSGQGRNGGTGRVGNQVTTAQYGTGGGAAAAGGVTTNNTDGNGGAGTAASISESPVTYAVGGGIRLTPVTLNPNTGNGGDGKRGSSVTIGSNGSSGIVIIRYALVQPVTPENIPSAASNLPTLRQEMEIYKDGVRFFHGNVTSMRTVIKPDTHEHQVTVSGAWWFLEKVPFMTNIQDGVGTLNQRLSAVFGTATQGQNLQTSIASAINQSAELGCPIATIAGGSTVAPMHEFPRITLNQSTCGQVLAELIRLVPDAMVHFDYSNKPARMHVVRRPTCPTTSFDEKTAPITSIDVNPIIELEVNQVTLPSVTRNLNGLTLFNSQTSGTAQTGKNITKRQVLTISGPELDTFLPNDLFDSQKIVRSTSFAFMAHDSDSSLISTARANSLTRIPISIDRTAFTFNSSRDTPGSTSGSRFNESTTFSVGGFRIVSNNGVTLTNHSILTSGEPADWAGIQAIPCTVSGQMWVYILIDTGSTPSSDNYNRPAWVQQAGFISQGSGYAGTDVFSDRFEIWTKQFSFTGFATPGAAGSSTVFKPADYSFINPPLGLANFLRETQNWLPYEGEIVLEQEDVGAARYVGTKVNVTNSLPFLSTMGALVSSETLEIESGRTTITLGAPPRNDYRTIVDKIRKTSQDNIVYI